MTKLEIQTAISTYLEKNPIILNDLLGSTIKLTSYDNFIQELSYITNTFKNIPEYSKSAQEYLIKMESFINSCVSTDKTALVSHINSQLHSKICGLYSSHITLQALSSSSLNKSPESSPQAIQQIYDELGYSELETYITLVKNPTYFTSYISSSKTQLVAMHYLLIRTNHHSNTKLTRNMTAKNLYKIMQDNLSASLSEITSQKEEFVTYMDSEKQAFETWYQSACEKAEQTHAEKDREYQAFLNESKTSIEQIKNTYHNELKLKKPAEFMKDESKRYKWAAIRWAIATIVLTMGLLYLLYLILDPKITFTEKLITINLFSNQMPVYSSVIIFSMIGLVIYIIRLFIKMAVSSKHLSDEYHQKYSLTYFYLSLLFEGKLEQKQADVILATLFTKADTGLLKNDSSSENELITTLFSMMK